MATTASSGTGTGEPSVEIGSHYAIIGMDGREYKVEVMGKRVSDIDTDVYIHYEGTDKRLDEWVDAQRIMPLKDSPAPPPPGASQSSSTENDKESSNSPELEASSRQKRKHGKDEVAQLTGPQVRKRPGVAGNNDTSQDTSKNDGKQQQRHDDIGDDDDAPRVRNVEWILYAGFDIATWYYSPFPEEYHDCQRLFICDHCLKYVRHVDNYVNHTRTCKLKRPPGALVYSKGTNKIYKVDGSKEKLYCQNLSLLGKLFLDNKTLYFDVTGFHFFVLTETRAGDRSDVPVGFFSKETVSYDGYNLACILVLPPFQRKSYGKLLIEFSYELTKMEGKVGSPEKPLSDLGKLGYVSYWITAILRELYPQPWPAKRMPHLLPLSGKSRNRAASLKHGSQSVPPPPPLPLTTAEPLAQGQPATVPPPLSSSTSSTALVETASSSSLTTDVKREPLTKPMTLPAVTPGSGSTAPGPMDMDLDLDMPAFAVSTKTSNGPVTVQEETEQDNEIAFSIRELASRTGIMEEDLLETLVSMGWMRWWLPPTDQDSYPPVKEAKRGYRKLLQFYEQQHLLGMYGSTHESGESSEHRAQSHHHHQQHHPSANANGGNKHAAAEDHVSEFNSIHLDGVMSSLENGATKVESDSSTGEESIMTTLQRLEQQKKSLVEEFNPVSYLEMPDSDDDGDNDSQSSSHHQNNQHQRHPAHQRSSLLSHSDLNPVNVAVVTMEMVKAYQDKHNIRLDYYIDRDAIDWLAYKKSLDP